MKSCILLLVSVAALVSGHPHDKRTLASYDPMINPGMIQGDIKGVAMVPPGTPKEAIIGDYYRWTGNTVPYSVAQLSASEAAIVRGAMDEIEERTCLKFVQRSSESNYIDISSNQAGCWSYVGMIGGRQELSLQSNGCMYHGTALHEIMHALGFYHEHNRRDRDQYLTINWQNIDPNYYYAFEIPSSAMDAGWGYNYQSIMHYDSYGFSTNGEPTMVPTDPNVQLVHPAYKDRMEESDAVEIRTIYNC